MTKLLKAGTESENQQPKRKIVVYYKNKGDYTVTDQVSKSTLCKSR